MNQELTRTKKKGAGFKKFPLAQQYSIQILSSSAPFSKFSTLVIGDNKPNNIKNTSISKQTTTI